LVNVFHLFDFGWHFPWVAVDLAMTPNPRQDNFTRWWVVGVLFMWNMWLWKVVGIATRLLHSF
jgi:hypothetical protein